MADNKKEQERAEPHRTILSIANKRMRIYLDNCCYNRPFDTPENETIIFEARAKMIVQQLITTQKVDLVYSLVSLEEINNNPFRYKRERILKFLEHAKIYVGDEKRDEIEAMAVEVMRTGIKYKDASHTAASIIARCDFLITTDKRFLKYKSDRIKLINPIDFIRIWEEQ